MKYFDRLGLETCELLIAVDIWINVLLGGSVGETLSARFQNARAHNGLAELACDILDKLDDNHCEKAVENKRI